MMIIRRVLGSLLWIVALVVLLGQFGISVFDWKLVDYATIAICLLAGYTLIKK
jgi:hypothetical protein